MNINLDENTDKIITDMSIITGHSKSELVERLVANAIKMINSSSSVTPKPKTGHCKDCKWWKDSDGMYRRGVGAESKCPINNVSVNHGLGYCYMYEPQERSDKE